jgi:hypothetical protein
MIPLIVLCRFNNPQFFSGGGLDLVLNSMGAHVSNHRLQDQGITLLLATASDSNYKYSQSEVERLTAAVGAMLVSHTTRVTELDTVDVEGWQTPKAQERTIIALLCFTKCVFNSDSAGQLEKLGVVPAVLKIMHRNASSEDIMTKGPALLQWLAKTNFQTSRQTAQDRSSCTIS